MILLLAQAMPVASPSAMPGKGPRIAMEESLERQRQSIAKQKETVRMQTGTAEAGDPQWFTIPWSKNKDGQFLEPPAPMTPAAPAGTVVNPLPADPAPASAASFGCLPMLPSTLDPVIRTAAARNGYRPEILRSVIARESAFDPCAVSSKGALGLMQLMPATASGLGVGDPFDPVESIEAGARYLGELLGRYGGDWRRALGAYNAGPGVVDRYGGVPPFAETTRFVESVLGGQ
ncbi:MAG: lytic transglycosylase domain-containing protein [Bryobacteraceae bacterium]